LSRTQSTMELHF